jgi:hypothetical protein
MLKVIALTVVAPIGGVDKLAFGQLTMPNDLSSLSIKKWTKPLTKTLDIVAIGLNQGTLSEGEDSVQYTSVKYQDWISCFLYCQHYFCSFYKKATLMSRSTVLRLPPQIAYRGLYIYIYRERERESEIKY